MTLVYDINLEEYSLTVPSEAVRGLYYRAGSWLLYVSDPTTNALAVFRVPGCVASDAASSMQMARITRCDGTAFMNWILKRDFIVVDRLSDDGRASQFPPQMRAGPRPSMDRPAPSTSTTPASKPAPRPAEGLNPADVPHKPVHPMDRPADPSM